MASLIDPNIAYLLLVVGAVLAIMALFAPGTGIHEIGAIFVLFLAGWEISQLQINWWALVILVIGVVPFIIAVRKSHNMVFLVVALVAFVLGSAYLFKGSAWWKPGVNLILALVASVIASGYIWIATTKVLETERIKPRHDLTKLVGEVGEARTNVSNEGSVQIESELWSARSSAPILAGSKVRVVKRDGFTLEVEQIPPKSQ